MKQNIVFRFRCAFLAALLAVSLSVPSLAYSKPFADLSGVSGSDQILALQEGGYIKGVAEGIFAPGRIITGAECIQLYVNLLGLNLDHVQFIRAPKATDYFENADDDAWYAEALIIASVNGLELPAGLDPDAPWTREEFTYHLMRALHAHVTMPPVIMLAYIITDEDEIDETYSGMIQSALAYRIAELDEEGYFYPKENLTRAEAAVQIARALAYVKAQEPAPD